MLLARSRSTALISTVACGVVLEGAGEADVRTGGAEPAPVGVVEREGGGVVVLDGAVGAEGAPDVSALAECPKIFDIMSPKMLMTDSLLDWTCTVSVHIGEEHP